ncbi:MAG: glycosyltransferase [Oscillospiraceae bacterium]|nr:glycosyltransferase [Oscillospiraceae bacterium]
MLISIIIPMYNEQNTLLNTIAQVDFYLRSRFDGNKNFSYEIIASDDGSADNTRALLNEACKQYDRLRIVANDVNRGKGAAVRNGILHAEGDIIIFTDCDLAYGTDVIGRMAEMFDPGTDIVIGSRNLSKDGYEGYTFLRKLMSKTYIKLISAAAGFKHSDSQSGIKGFRKEAAHKIFSRCEIDRFAFDLEALMIAGKFGFKIREMPVKIINHAEGTSKVRIVKDTLRMLRDVAKIKKRLKTLT